MSCGRHTVTAAQVNLSPAGISWLNGGECGSHITASVQIAKQEKGNHAGWEEFALRIFPARRLKKGE